MDSRTLAFAISLLGTALVFITAVLAAVRRERCLTILAAGLFADILGSPCSGCPSSTRGPLRNSGREPADTLPPFKPGLEPARPFRPFPALAVPVLDLFRGMAGDSPGLALRRGFIPGPHGRRFALFILAGAESRISFKRSPPGMPPVLRFAGTVAAAGSMLFYAIRILLIVAVSAPAEL
jgi:hypothetical protein